MTTTSQILHAERLLIQALPRWYLLNAIMSGHPQGHYDEGYGQHQQGNTDSYYQDDHGQAYYDEHGGYADQGHHQQGGDGYYDESYVVVFNRQWTITTLTIKQRILQRRC
jgi:hypothetical protein